MAPPLEISIPTTSLVSATGSDKAYTLYNITLRLPLRSFVIQKRYSEFAALHATLTGLVGEAPPVPLPAKSWFRSTVDSADLTETRRSGFEAYLRAVAESPDHRWRDTSAWRAFLNLPSTGNGSGSGTGSSSNLHGHHQHTHSIESQLPAIGLSAANAAAASDPGTWLDLHKEMKKALHDARLQLARRDAAGDQTGNGGGSLSAAVAAGAAAKRELVKAGSLLAALTTGLESLQKTPPDGGRRLGDGELRRRRDLLAAARVEKEGLETLSASLARANESGTPGSSRSSSLSMGRRDVSLPETGDRATLFAGASGSNGRSGGRPGGRVLGAPLPETERTRERDNGGMVQLQKEMMAEQDEQVETLARIVQRQRELGMAVKHEVDQQIGMLTQLDEDTERVGAKMKVARERTRRLG